MMYELKFSQTTAIVKRHDSKRARKLRLTVAGGQITLTVPNKTSERIVELFLQEKADWIQDKWIQLEQTAKRYPDIAINTKRHYEEYKEDALAQAEQKVTEWNVDLSLSFNKVRVRRMKTRWGSCTGKKNLHFNYKILFLPEELQDYLVVHELCHLMHPNHSPAFWSSIESLLSDYKTHHRKLRNLA